MKLKKPKTQGREKSIYEIANDQLSMMKFKDLKIACVGRGMPFDSVLDATQPKLASYFYENFERSEDPKLAPAFDAYCQTLLEERGYKNGDAILHPSLRLSFSKHIDKLPEVRINEVREKPKIKKEETQEPKIVRKKDEETGIMSGTKKSLLYSLVAKGKMAKEAIFEEVKKHYPDANEKSLKIWYSKAIKVKSK